MGWSEHRAGLWDLSIFSRLCSVWVFPQGVDRMYTSQSAPPRGETPHAGDPAYATAEEGSRSLVNEGFTPSHGVRAQGVWP